MTTFKTRARTLDMLGKQQIAGMPTAISELFKNAHDAYADRVVINYYRSDGLFVLRDDGVGMSKQEFIERWMTIGTESKFDPSRTPTRKPGKEVRPMLGEKGIGRLAVATIGPQLMVLTRRIVDKGESDLTAAFLNWSIFEWPGIDLDEIEIPLRSFSPGTLPTARDVAEMVQEFYRNAEIAGRRFDRHLLERIISELDQFDIDPQEIDSYLEKPSLREYGCGTYFIIEPCSTLLADDIDGDPSASKAALKKATPLKKALLGFSNTMVPNSSSVIHTAFRDHKSDDISEELISENEFFTPEEFRDTDHRVRGKFDEFGQFRGVISIYGDSTPDHIIPWGGGHGIPTKCGPFSIDFAAFEGENKHSTIPQEDHAKLAAKTEQLGGLSIYRNGIRVLPYGDTDYDWLDIEFRRTKSAYYYYFSHRKMFGAVEIDSKENQDLRKKQGERDSKRTSPNRQFRSILQNFFLQIAADFFRSDGVHAAVFDDRKSELSREEARSRRIQQVSVRKKKFEADLNVFFERLAENAPQKEVKELFEKIAGKLRLACNIADSEIAAREVIELESRAHAEIRELESRYNISRPRIGLSKRTLRDWSIYKSQFILLQEREFRPMRERVEDLIGGEVTKAKLSLNRRVRAEAVLEDLGRNARKSTGNSSRDVRTEADNVASEAREVAGISLKAVENELRAVISEFQQLDDAEMSDEKFVESRDELELRILTITEEKKELLRSILEQLRAIDITGKTSTTEQLMAIEQRNLSLEEKYEADAQLAQLGMAIEIINHEFSGTIRSVRNGLRKLKAWADVNEGLGDLYDSIQVSFDHLDGYLTLFTPLQHRLYRKAVAISGSEIFDFLAELFRARLERHNVSLTATKTFAKARVVGFPSSFYPVFVNLVDNSIFWLSQQNPQRERSIRLDEQAGCLLVANTGPGVSVRDRESIFEFGFSRKPGGRGMGLHIGRESLRRIGFDLKFIDGDGGAKFGIIRMEESLELHMGSTTKHLHRDSEIAERFLQTAVAVDDEAYMSPDWGDTPTGEIAFAHPFPEVN